ncbi:MAG: hypothetical protein HPY52_15515 [Firmicutes bacterium]|nr:hypothetical protein [Bacillota bacterium]
MVTGVTTMEFISVRDFKAQVTRLIREKRNVLVLKNGRPAGYFLPWDETMNDNHFRKAALETLMRAMQEERTRKGITEEEVLVDFEAFRKNRSRR